MNKKLIALAVVGAVASPAALAQGANPVTLYGQTWLMVNNVKASGGAASVSSRTNIVDESSRIGVRGTEDLGGGLKAFFQIESGVPVDAGGGTLGSRNSGVGLQGGFGSFLIGRWDTPFKLSAIITDPTGQNTIGNQLSVINTGDFNRRQNNSIQYWSPKMGGFSARVLFSPDEVKAAGANSKTVGFSLDYASGPFQVNYAHERHDDQRGSASNAAVDEKGNNLSATFVMGSLKLGVTAQRIKSTGRSDVKAEYISLLHTAGKNQFFVTYGRSRDGQVSGAASPEAKQASIGYMHNFSKRTSFHARYASLKNNAASSLAMNASGISGAADADPKGFGIGIKHTF